MIQVLHCTWWVGDHTQVPLLQTSSSHIFLHQIWRPPDRWLQFSEYIHEHHLWISPQNDNYSNKHTKMIISYAIFLPNSGKMCTKNQMVKRKKKSQNHKPSIRIITAATHTDKNEIPIKFTSTLFIFHSAKPLWPYRRFAIISFSPVGITSRRSKRKNKWKKESTNIFSTNLNF